MFSLDNLAAIIAERAAATAEKSYTRSLLDKGPAGAAKKFGEEAIELVIAAAAEDGAAVRAEAADVLYHLLVVLEARGVKLSDVLCELERRTVRSGHEEKAARPK
jgi:phosphoribosyl-ATP pyrophosphohydrolase